MARTSILLLELFYRTILLHFHLQKPLDIDIYCCNVQSQPRPSSTFPHALMKPTGWKSEPNQPLQMWQNFPPLYSALWVTWSTSVSSIKLQIFFYVNKHGIRKHRNHLNARLDFQKTIKIVNKKTFYWKVYKFFDVQLLGNHAGISFKAKIKKPPNTLFMLVAR